jgi:hypothetical protein
MTKRGLQLVKSAQLPGSRTYRRKEPVDKNTPVKLQGKVYQDRLPR